MSEISYEKSKFYLSQQKHMSDIPVKLDTPRFRKVRYNQEEELKKKEFKKQQNQEKVGNFLKVFTDAGMGEDRRDHVNSVPNATKIINSGKKIGNKIGETNSKIVNFFDSQTEKVRTKFHDRQQTVAVQVPFIIALGTFAVTMDALLSFLSNILKGFVESVIKISSTVADYLIENYRTFISGKNDYQEYTIAVLTFIGFIFSNISQIYTTIVGKIKTFLISFGDSLYGSQIARIVDDVFEILYGFLLIKIFLFVVNLKTIIAAFVTLSIISFLLKLDDLSGTQMNELVNQLEEKKKAEEERKEKERKEQEMREKIEQQVKEQLEKQLEVSDD